MAVHIIITFWIIIIIGIIIKSSSYIWIAIIINIINITSMIKRGS